MARRVFFSFHYERDIWRVGQIRNSWVTKPNRETAGYVDAASWEAVEKKGEEAVKKWIDDQLNGTSVTAVLIGAETDGRYYVDYEIKKSHETGNGLMGIYIHNIKNSQEKTDVKGSNPFDRWSVTKNGQKVYFSSMYRTYDWVSDDGYNNLGSWVEQAAKDAGR